MAGYGDIARRAAPLLERRFAIVPLSREHGFDLDRPGALPLHLLPAEALVHSAPPPPTGEEDPRTANLLKTVDAAGWLPRRIVYLSTSGVYGDCAGARVNESRALNPQTGRAKRRVDAERCLERWCAERNVQLVVLRVPGIYAADRLPVERLRIGTPVLRHEEDVYTSHIHADDLAAIVARALEDNAPAGIYNAADDTELLMGDWLDLVADRARLRRPPRVARSEIGAHVPAELLSFMQESRRLDNRRLKTVLGVRLRYPTVHEGLAHEHVVGID